MKHAVIVHTIQDAEHCIQQGFHKTHQIFSTDVHVDCYLRHHYELESRDLCSYLDGHMVRQIQDSTQKTSYRLLEELDCRLAPAINEQLQLSLRYFIPLYSLTAARQLSLYTLLELCIKQMLGEYIFDSILVYDTSMGPFNGSIQSFFSQLFPQTRFRFVRYRVPAKNDNTRISNLRLQDMLLFLRKDDRSERYFKQINNKLQESSAGKGIFFFEPLGRMEFLPPDTVLYSFNPWVNIATPSFEYELSCRVLPSIDAVETICLATEDMEVLSLFYEDLCSDFCRNLMQYLRVVYSLQQLKETAFIHETYWEVPPFQGASALLNEYCMKSQDIRVTGVQTRATFFAGQTHSSYISVSILSRCHRYLTQGSTKNDIEFLYSASAVLPEIIVPAAKEEGIKNKPHSKKRKPADVAVYLTPTSSFTKTGQVSLYIQVQEELLQFLNEQQGENIHIVPYSIPGNENCAMLPLLKTLKNVTLISDATQESYLMKYEPKLILMDTPTPYLQDVLCTDVPVIVIEDKTLAFYDKVLEFLMKRAYYVGGLEEVKRLLQMHFSGDLQGKHDAEYVNQFCIRASSEGMARDQI